MPKMTRLVFKLIAIAIAVASVTTIQPASAVTVSEQEAYDIGVEAYLYMYPLVIMDVTRRQVTNIEAGKLPGRGPMNTFVHVPMFPPAEFRDVVRPNFDTLYSSTWLDLTEEPIIVSAPDTAGRYYMLPMLDMWTDVFANPGKRSTGTKEGHFGVVPPGWSGKLPDGVKRVNAPTGMVWIIGRTQTNGQADYAAVHKVQAGYKLTRLSEWGKMPSAPRLEVDPDVNMKTPPVIQLHKMAPGDFFTYAAELMKINPPHATDHDMVARLKRIGIEPGESFDFTKADPTVREALEKAASDAPKLMQDNATTIGRVVNGWLISTDTIGVYGNSYLKRAIIAMVALGANPPEDAVYPMSVSDVKGEPLDAANNYILRFEKDEIPQVDAFWSATLYDEDGFPVQNEIERHALGDRDELVFDKDGSLEIYLQADSPGKNKEANWIPAPKSGPFGVVLRLYGPRRDVLVGSWVPPGIEKIE